MSLSHYYCTKIYKVIDESKYLKHDKSLEVVLEVEQIYIKEAKQQMYIQ